MIKLRCNEAKKRPHFRDIPNGTKDRIISALSITTPMTRLHGQEEPQQRCFFSPHHSCKDLNFTAHLTLAMKALTCFINDFQKKQKSVSL